MAAVAATPITSNVVCVQASAVYNGGVMGRASGDAYYRGCSLGLVIIRKRGGFHLTLHHVGHDADDAVGVLDIGVRMKTVLGHDRVESQSKLLIG